MAGTKREQTGEAGAWRLLQLLLIAGGDEALLDEARRAAQETAVDWTSFLEAADQERVSPIAAAIVKGRDLVPATVEQELNGRYLANAKRNLLLLHELGRILEVLDDAGVETLVLKGAALAEVMYRTVAMRMMRDLDLLVKPEQIGEALRVLEELGYARTRNEPRAGAQVAFENEIVLHKEGQVTSLVEMHWSLFDSPFYQRLPFTWFWKTSRRVDTNSGPMRVLGSEAQVLYYAGHMQLHHAHERQFLWYYDLIQVITAAGASLDWDMVLKEGQDNYLVLALNKTLERAAALWRAPVPERVLLELASMNATEAEERAFAMLTAEKRPVAQRFLTDLRMMVTWRQRLIYAWINIFPTRAYMYGRYGFSSVLKLPYYYLYRFYLGARSIIGR